MATSTQLRNWWADWRCDTSKYARVAFPGAGREWNLLVADKTVPLWEAFTGIMRNHNYLFRESAGGSYNCRKIANTDSWSLHAYGLAVDLNPSKNPYGKPLRHDFPPQFIADVLDLTSNGKQAFTWGGGWSTPDSMHWQINVSPEDVAEPETNDVKPPAWAVTATQWHIDHNIYTDASPDDVDESAEFHRQTVFRYRMAKNLGLEDGPGAHNHDGRYLKGVEGLT